MSSVPPAYVDVQVLAQRVGLPEAWLRREAEADRIPSLRVGRRLMFSIEAVEAGLFDRARQSDDDTATVGPPAAREEST